MLLTKNIFERAKSDRGGYSKRQVQLLGVPWPLTHGWKKNIINKDYDESVISAFINCRKSKEEHTLNVFGSSENINTTIAYPNKPTEFEIHAELYVFLKAMGYNVRGEINHTITTDIRQRCGYKKSRFDLVVFDDKNEAKIIIEVKDGPAHDVSSTRQYTKYSMHNLPLLYHFVDTTNDTTLKSVEEIMND